MFVLVITIMFFILWAINIAGIGKMYGTQFGRMGRMMSLVLAGVMSFGYMKFYHSEKSDFGATVELVLMVLFGALAIGVSVVACFRLLESGLYFFQLSMRGAWSAGAMVLMIVICSVIAWKNAHDTIIKTVTIPVENLKKPSKILYLSDIHIARKSDLPFLKKIVVLINKVDADFVVINGDFVDGTGFEVGDFSILDEINKEVLFTYGNHEAYAGNDYVRSLLAPTKLKILSDEKFQIAGWEVLGLADMHGFDSKANQQLLAQKLQSISWETDFPKLLVLHEPIGPKVAEKYGVNLQVAGHTHNGQIFPNNLLVKLAFSYINGLYRFDTSSLFVSSGVGTWGPPMRLGSRSEVILLNLIPA